MSFRPLPLLLAGALAVAGVALSPPPPEASAAAARTRRKAAILPGWSVIADYVLPIDVGMYDLTGTYAFTLEGQDGQVSLRYDDHAALVGDGFWGLTFFRISGTTAPAAPGASQEVSLADDPRHPDLRFDGTVDPSGIDLSGTVVRNDGWGGVPGTTNGPMALRRTPRTSEHHTFKLTMATTMDRKGVVKGRRGTDGKEMRASLTLFGGRSVTAGLIRGKVVTTAEGLTTAKVKVRGKKWSVLLTGPVDEEGFHAAATIRASGFALDGVPVLLPVTDGPEPPPPPPPPPPKNLVTDAIARISGGNVTVTRENVPRKFWKALGRGTDLTVQFPTSILSAPDETLVADAATGTGAAPVRFSAAVRSTTYYSGATGASVTLQIPRGPDGSLYFSTVVGKSMRVLCRGTISDGSGHSKTVDVLLEARVVP